MNGRRKTKWFSTGLPVKGNKKKAEKLLYELRNSYVPEDAVKEPDEILFSDFMLQWLEVAKPTVAVTTYASYCNMVQKIIVPYFKKTGITLGALKATDIQAFYTKELQWVKANSVIHYHANIHRALKYAVKQAEYQRVCGNCYDKRYLGYICVDEMGTLLSPDYLSAAFPKLLAKHGLRRIRFHDLRHSCASLLLANGVSMKQIQEWLGHSDFSTTANVYAHLDYTSKLSSAEAILNGLSLDPN